MIRCMGSADGYNKRLSSLGGNAGLIREVIEGVTIADWRHSMDQYLCHIQSNPFLREP